MRKQYPPEGKGLTSASSVTVFNPSHNSFFLLFAALNLISSPFPLQVFKVDTVAAACGHGGASTMQEGRSEPGNCDSVAFAVLSPLRPRPPAPPPTDWRLWDRAGLHVARAPYEICVLEVIATSLAWRLKPAALVWLLLLEILHVYFVYYYCYMCVCFYSQNANISFNIGSSSFPQCLVSEKLNKEIM